MTAPITTLRLFGLLISGNSSVTFRLKLLTMIHRKIVKVAAKVRTAAMLTLSFTSVVFAWWPWLWFCLG